MVTTLALVALALACASAFVVLLFPPCVRAVQSQSFERKRWAGLIAGAAVATHPVLETAKMPKSMTKGRHDSRQVPGRTSDEVQRPCLLSGARSRTRDLLAEALRWCRIEPSTGSWQSANEPRPGLDAGVN